MTNYCISRKDLLELLNNNPSCEKIELVLFEGNMFKNEETKISNLKMLPLNIKFKNKDKNYIYHTYMGHTCSDTLTLFCEKYKDL